MSKIVSRVALTAGALSLNIVLRKYASRVSTALDEAAEVQAETAKTQTHAQVTQRLVARTLSDSQEVLRHLADQPLEASTADIQQACASNEQFIKSMLTVR